MRQNMQSHLLLSAFSHTKTPFVNRISLKYVIHVLLFGSYTEDQGPRTKDQGPRTAFKNQKTR